MLGFTDLVERHHQLQHAEATVRRTKHECRRTDQQLADVEDRRDTTADRLDQFHRGQIEGQREHSVRWQSGVRLDQFHRGQIEGTEGAQCQMAEWGETGPVPHRSDRGDRGSPVSDGRVRPGDRR